MRPVALPFALLLACCATAAVGARAVVSVKDEIQLGREAQREVRRQVPELRDDATRRYVADLGRRLAAKAGGPKYPYSFSIANDRALNAFALPGGPVWIHRGIIDAAADESQLAGVLAHEIAHIAQRHAADQMTKQLVANGLLGLLGAVLGSGGGAHTARIGAQVLANGYMLKFSRDDEREADRVGVQILRRAGWNPNGMAKFMDTLRREAGRDPGSVEVFLSSHPATTERAATLRQAIGPRPSGRTDSASFRSIRQRVRKLPAPPPAPTRK